MRSINYISLLLFHSSWLSRIGKSKFIIICILLPSLLIQTVCAGELHRYRTVQDKPHRHFHAYNSKQSKSDTTIYTIRIDLTTQVLGLEMPIDKGRDRNRVTSLPRLRDGRSDESTPHTFEATLQAVPNISEVTHFCSASILAQKAKQFDDGLYAVVEIAAQNGAGKFSGKRELLEMLTALLESQPPDSAQNVLGLLLAAKHLGVSDDPSNLVLDSNHVQVAQLILDKFLAEDLRAKPIGFYSWSSALEQIFRQDRLLQTAFRGQEQIGALIQVLREQNNLRDTYTRYLQFVSRLTNPFPPELNPLTEYLDSGHAPDDSVYFFPPSRGHETELIKQLAREGSIPKDFDLCEEMIRRIDAGTIDLTPAANSGWYDYQTYALEPLVGLENTPEASRLRLNPAYRNHLHDLFKGILALTRETHIKQLQIVTLGLSRMPPTIDIKPELSLEPLATYFLRRAESYRFVRGVIVQLFGESALTEIHRMAPDRTVNLSLDEEIKAMEDLFYGAYVTVCRELGLELAPESDELGSGDPDLAFQCYNGWQQSIADDPDIAFDNRMMVPVYYDPGLGQTKVWAFLGWGSRRLNISFASEPEYEVFDEENELVPPGTVEIRFVDLRSTVVYPVMVELFVTEILNRAEFQAHCDQYGTQTAILENLR